MYLPDLQFYKSAVSALKGRGPYYLRLAVRAVDAQGRPLNHIVQPALSNAFQVVTKKAGDHKKETPSTRDPVRCLPA